jgi:polyphosphate kinase 2 (PPK2 family)
VVRVVALAAPTEKEKKSWYFQRYVQQLPTAGEIALFDRSWYNRGGVEKVMGFCSDEEHKLFLKHCPVFENMLIEDGFILIKYWFSVSDEEQEKRFVARMSDVKTQWKLSPMDVQARAHWVDYSKAKDEMFAATHTATSPWYVVDSNDKKKARGCIVTSRPFLTRRISQARLNCISHLLTLIPYADLPYEPVEMPDRQLDTGYVRPPKGTNEILVPERY